MIMPIAFEVTGSTIIITTERAIYFVCWLNNFINCVNIHGNSMNVQP